jgi:hypothetical protein
MGMGGCSDAQEMGEQVTSQRGCAGDMQLDYLRLCCMEPNLNTRSLEFLNIV